MKVQTLGDTSSLTSCSPFESLSTNHWAGPQEVTICGHHGDRVCGWALDLMRYLEQMKYDAGERGGGVVEMEREKWGGVYHVEDKEKQEVESQAPSMVIVVGRGR